MFKKFVAMILVISLSLSIILPTFANEITDFSEEALRVSDEFVSVYPSGAFSLSAVAMETHEYSGRSVINVVRQGGTAGHIAVTVKAIDISAKYGKDYRLSIPGFILDKDIYGNETTPTIMENGQTEVMLAEEEEKTESVQDSVYESVQNSVYDSTNENPVDIGITTPKSIGLRAAKEQTMGKTSDREKLASPDTGEQEQLNTAIAAAGNFYAEAPGTVFTLSFADGERTKSFNLDIINDAVPEAQEQIVFVITDVTEGGFIGLQKETTVNILDDEPYERPVLRFSSNSFTAAGESAIITLTRSEGVNYYAGAYVSTIGDSARPGTDYTELGQKILFVPGQTELSLEIPIVKNQTDLDKYFFVKIEPDESILVSGDEVVQVLIPRKETQVLQSMKLMSDGALQAAPEGVILGDSKKIFDDPNQIYFGGGSDQGHWVHPSGWYEGIFRDKWQWAQYNLMDFTYPSYLESVYVKAMLFDLGHSGNFHAWMEAGFEVVDENDVYIKTINNNIIDVYHNSGDTNVLMNKQIMGRDWPIAKEKGMARPFVRGVNDQCGDDFAARIYSFEYNYRYFEFEILPANNYKEYTFDFGNATSKEEYVTPGNLELTAWSGELVKGFYTSDMQIVHMKAKNLRSDWYLKGVNFYYAEDKPPKFFDLSKFDRIIFDNEWLANYADTYGKDGKFRIQPVFERKEATLTVSMPETEKDKGIIAGLINSKTPSVTLTEVKDTTDSEKTYKLHAGDKVILRGTGNGSYMVQGYNVSYNNGLEKSEAGSQSAGIHTLTLTETVKVTPIFGAQLLNIKRDPDNKNTLPNIQGTITYGGQTTTQDGQLGDIHSGQYVEFVSIPPPAYTTQWANRTGDTNNNGVLDYNELYDSNGKLYRQFDYNQDGQLDKIYDTPIFGDLFGYRVNQPNPIFYYYYVPMTGQTLYNGKVSGSIVTREYSIRKGYTQTTDADGVKVDKLVPVEGASVKMGGSFDAANPNAQLGYGTSTGTSGRFNFDVENVLKNSSYFLSIDYNGASYLDTINPSATKQVILPTFTSMRPISINAVPQDGEDLSIVAGSVVMLKDKDVCFNLLTASLENNVKVKKAIFRVYSSNGTLIQDKTKIETVDDGNKTVFKVNLNDTFTSNARLTVQLEDQNGNQSMEYDSGFQFRPPMQATSILPAFMAPYTKSVPLVDTVMGVLDIGNTKLADTTANDEGYTIYIGIGHQFDEKSKEFKNTIDEAKSGSKTAKDSIKAENKQAPQKKDSNLKVKSSIANNLGVKVSLKMNIKFDPEAPEEKESPYYFGDMLLMVTLEDSLAYETRIALPVGISFIIRLEVGGSVTGYVTITPHTPLGEIEPVKVYADKYGNYPYTESNASSFDRKFDYGGGVILEPYISISAGPVYGVAKVMVEGRADFYLVFSTSSSGSGTVTLTAQVKATVLGFEVYKKTFAKWSTNLFGSASTLMENMLSSENLDESVFEPVSRSYLDNRSGWVGDQPNLQTGGSSVTDFTEKTLKRGIYPDPDAQLMRIDEDSLLMVFIEDHAVRSDENRGAVYYSISHDNGATFSEPILLDNDGTLDSHPRLSDIGDRILLVYSSLDKEIPKGMSMEDILELHNLEMAFFDKSTYKFSTPEPITQNTAGDYHSDVDGNAVYDEETGKVLIIYNKTDYTSDMDEGFNASDLFNSYPAITYRLYDTQTGSFLPYDESDYPEGLTAEGKIQWDSDWYGQRFLNTQIIDDKLPGGMLSDPLIFDLTAKTKGRTAYIAYTVDMDGNMETLHDRDIYLQTYSFADKTFTKPFKMSDMREEVQAKSDGKPQLILYNGDMHLFFHADTAIHYYNLDTLFAELNSGDREPITLEDDPATEEIESGSYDLDDYKLIAPKIALDYSAENLPSDDYQVLVGDDGKLYLIWTEETLRLAEGVEPGSQASLKPENIYHENQIYASIFYERLMEDKDTAEINHDYGKWSGKVQITAGPGSYGDVSASVMANGHMIAAAKKSEKILLDDSDTSPRVDNQDTMELVALTLTPSAQAEMKQDSIDFGTVYPVPNEVVTIKATVDNHGLMPMLNPFVDFYAVQGETETFIGTGQNSSPVYGGSEAIFNTQWTAPDNIQDIKVIAKLRSGDSQTVIAQSEKLFPFGTKLEYSLFDLDYVVKNDFRAYIEVHHTGNKPLDNAELVISLINAEKNLLELKRVSLDKDMDALEMFVIDEGFELPQEYLMEGSADIEVKIESAGKLLVKQTGKVEKNVLSLYQELINEVTGVELSKTDLTLTRGSTSTIKTDVYPATVGEKNSIIYKSSDPRIATVNDEGEITALMSGSAIIKAYAVPKVDVSTQTSDGHVLDGNVLDTLALEDCKSDAVNVTVVNKESESSSSSGKEKVTVSGYNAVIAGSSVSGITLPVNVNTEAGSATVDLRTLAENVFNGKETTVITLPSIPGVNAYTLRINAASLSGSQGEGRLTMVTDTGSITIPADMLSGILGTVGKEVGINISQGDKSNLPNDVKEAIGDRPLVQLTLTLDGQKTEWNNPNAPVKVSIPYTPTAAELADPEHIVIWYIDGSDNVVPVPSGRYDPVTSTVTFTTTHFSRYAVAYVHKSFGDLGSVEWARRPIEVMTSKGIINGTGSNTYSPKASITRADYLILLVKTFGLKANFDGNFEDVQPENYYYEAVGIAKKLGLTSGIGNNRFNPKENISRQDMMVLTARALEKFKGLKAAANTNQLDKFNDKGDIVGYAARSIATLVKEGLISGSGNKLDPRRQTTRAEAAVLLYKIYKQYPE